MGGTKGRPLVRLRRWRCWRPERRTAGTRVILRGKIGFIRVGVGCNEEGKEGEDDDGGDHGGEVVCLLKRIFPARGITGLRKFFVRSAPRVNNPGASPEAFDPRPFPNHMRLSAPVFLEQIYAAIRGTAAAQGRSDLQPDRRKPWGQTSQREYNRHQSQ